VAGWPVTSGQPLAGRTAVVTGSSRGIGAATVRALSLAGARVIGISRSPGAPVPNATTIQCDLLDPPAVAKAIGAVQNELFGAPDILVNNAGVFASRPVDQTTPATFAAMLALNLSVPFEFVREFLPVMSLRGQGHIVTVGSIADHQALSGNAAYAASKFGVRGLHEVLALELKGTGVRATLISPGAVDTTLWDAIDPPTTRERVSQTGRSSSGFPSRDAMLLAEDVADAIVYAVTRPERVAIGEIRLAKS
jgi:NAD(P)-dependent dehydrogenase (short-subunit alcohol dehydrogenase family)